MSATRVTLVMNTVAPYRIPVFESLASREEIDLTVVFGSEGLGHRHWDVDLSATSFSYRVLRSAGMHVADRDWSPRISPALVPVVRRTQPNAIVVGGYASPDDWALWAYARSCRLPLTLWFGSTAYSERASAQGVARLKRRFINGVDSFVTYGSLAAEHLRARGVPASRIVVGCNVGDTPFFSSRTEATRADRQPGDPVRFVFVGQLIERKGVSEALQAFESASLDRAELHVVGTGPLRSMVDAAAARGVPIVAHGHLDSQQVAEIYARSDVMLIPSRREVFSIVTSEALASGLFTITSPWNGAAPDLITDGVTGLVVDPADGDALREAVQRADASIRTGATSAEAIARSVADRTPAAYAGAIAKAIGIAQRARSGDS
ncbi:MAG: glycosyltransferase family 4 protein [Actinomycetota bacterium]